MEGQVRGWLRLLSLLYICILPAAAYGKCKGRWAIHSCLGGNGKRSDPSLGLDEGLDRGTASGEHRRLESGGLLQRLLSRTPYGDMDQYPGPADSIPLPRSPLAAPDPALTQGGRQSFPSDGRRFSTRTALRLRSLIRMLMEEQRMRDSAEDQELA